MLRDARSWLRLAGAWLILAGLTQMGWHVWRLVLENGMIGLLEFAANAMRQARSLDPMRPTLWSQFRLFSVGLGLLYLFAGAVNLLLATADTDEGLLRRYALFATGFWTLAFVPFTLVDPIVQAWVVAAFAVPLHGSAVLVSGEPDSSEPQ
ncbi:MAG: hypothetical protein AAF389_07150 [Gemmatimonadota bacterium]